MMFVLLGVVMYIDQYFVLYCTFFPLRHKTFMAGLKNSCDDFAYTIHSEEGRCVLNIADATAILVLNEETGQFEVDLNCISVPTFLTIPNVDGAEPTIMQMQSGPNGDLWIRKDGPNHR